MWINGIEQSHLTARDRAVQFGDGCFTTAAIIKGNIALFDWHIQRLQQSCERLWLQNVDWQALAGKCCRRPRAMTARCLK